MRWTSILVVSVLAGCHGSLRSMTKVSTTPRQIVQGVGFHEVQLDPNHRLWIYEPISLVSRKRSCVLIAPAGSHLFDGMTLGEGDRAEQIPYAKAGYIVVAYDVSGPLESQSERGVSMAAATFREADLGLKDMHRALAYIRANLPVDPRRVVAVGHSSAATLALMTAEEETGIAACVAYAPVVDVPEHLRPDSRTLLERDVPGMIDDLERLSPSSRKNRLRCPTFIFHAADDATVPKEPLASFAKSVPSIEWLEVPTGGHYDSMIARGIPAGIAFLKRHGLGP